MYSTFLFLFLIYNNYYGIIKVYSNKYGLGEIKKWQIKSIIN